jgi:hypothetical protein
MNRFLAILLALGILTLGCTLPANTPIAQTASPTGAPVPSASNTPAQTDTAAAPSDTPTVTLTPTPQPNVVCNNLSFYLDPAVASGSHCETIPESANPDDPYFAINPQTTRVTLDGYSIGPRFHTPHLEVFSVQRFQELLPDVVPSRVADMQALLAGAPPTHKAIPLLPVFNAAEMFKTKIAMLPFHTGNGMRYLTQYAQAFYLVNNHDLFLSYQGLTDDGRFWISVILPITHPSLPANGDNPPGNGWVDFQNNADGYFAQAAATIDALPAGSFAPSMELIDTLLKSITIQP